MKELLSSFNEGDVKSELLNCHLEGVWGGGGGGGLGEIRNYIHLLSSPAPQESNASYHVRVHTKSMYNHLG